MPDTGKSCGGNKADRMLCSMERTQQRVTFGWPGRLLCRADIKTEISVASRSWPLKQVWEKCYRQREQ